MSIGIHITYGCVCCMSIGTHMDVCAQQATCRKVHFALVHEEFLANLAWKARGKQQMAKLVDHGEVLPRVLGERLCASLPAGEHCI